MTQTFEHERYTGGVINDAGCPAGQTAEIRRSGSGIIPAQLPGRSGSTKEVTQRAGLIAGEQQPGSLRLNEITSAHDVVGALRHLLRAPTTSLRLQTNQSKEEYGGSPTSGSDAIVRTKSAGNNSARYRRKASTSR